MKTKETRNYPVAVSEILFKNDTMDVLCEVTHYKDEDGDDDPDIEIIENRIENEYANQHYTPSELIKECKILAKTLLSANNISKFEKSHLEYIIRECENWQSESLEVNID